MKFAASSAIRLISLAAVVLGLNLRAAETNSPREHLSLDANWKFHLGDDWPNALRLDKAGASSGPASQKFSDQAWRTVNLPHDWAIELPFDKTSDMSHGFKPVGPGFPQNSIGWYRRTFDLSTEDSGKRIWLTFDGVFRDATVWVNGWLVKRHEGGYNPFREDITEIVKFGGKNVIAVKVDASKFEGWFYEGAGIYRHVWLDKTAPVAIAPDGIIVTTMVEHVPKDTIFKSAGDFVYILAKAELFDKSTNFHSKATGRFELISPDGKSLWKTKSSISFHGRIQGRFSDGAKFRSLELWSPESPKLFKLITTVEVDGRIFDRVETSFGIRTFAFDKDKGFLLNGQPYELKGTCNHQDMAGVGAALPDALQYFRIAKLKEFGCNAYRTSHNPPTPELLDACDHLGMIVMDECRLLGSDSENLQKWEDQIRRDRNHASVGIWSICNEEPREYSADGGRVGATMQRLVKQLDPTRPVTAAEDVGDSYDGLMGSLEVRGWNYHIGQQMDDYHAKHPDQPNVGTEQASAVSTRGIYERDRQRGYVDCYDDLAMGWASTTEQWWSFFADRPWLSGGFVWTGFDYRGEPTPYGWPCINSHFGVLDMCGFPKDNFYYYQAWWTTNTVLHLLPHWNWAGKEGQEIRVDALSNCGEVELFLNGASLGKQTMKRNSKLSWKVKYAPGTLSAKGFNDGELVAETKVETTGEPMSVQLMPNRTTINADGEDVSVITAAVTDAQGRVVPVAGNKINFSIEGAGKILGVGNGDPSCHEPDTFIDQPMVKYIPANHWRWKLMALPAAGASAPEYAAAFDDAAWVQASSEGNASQLSSGQTAIFRQHLKLTAEDLAKPGIQLHFGSIDDDGWVFMNGHLVGESHSWEDAPTYDLKKYLHEGDNVIAVGVHNGAGPGGLVQGVNVELTGQATASPWSRSAFNGLAQVLVQSTKDAGEIKLTATAEGLKSATATITAQPVALRPSVP